MANYIPKITYTELVTGSAKTITFTSEPEGDPFNEKIIKTAKVNESSDGSTQTQWSFNEQEYKLEFKFETSANKTLFETFITDHAFQGGVFTYQPHSDVDDDKETYQLIDKSVTFDRPVPSGSDFLYHFSFKIIRVLDFTYTTEELGVGSITETQHTITNDQTSWADVTGLSFDNTAVRGARIHYTVNRYHTTPNSETTEFGEIQIAYDTLNDTWEIYRSSAGDAGMTFQITSAGKVQYKSSDISGTVSRSAMRFRASTISIEV